MNTSITNLVVPLTSRLFPLLNMPGRKIAQNQKVFPGKREEIGAANDEIKELEQKQTAAAGRANQMERALSQKQNLSAQNLAAEQAESELEKLTNEEEVKKAAREGKYQIHASNLERMGFSMGRGGMKDYAGDTAKNTAAMVTLLRELVAKQPVKIDQINSTMG